MELNNCIYGIKSFIITLVTHFMHQLLVRTMNIGKNISLSSNNSTTYFGIKKGTENESGIWCLELEYELSAGSG